MRLVGALAGIVLVLVGCGDSPPTENLDAGMEADAFAPDGAPATDAGCPCDDRVACTSDSCTTGACVHTPDTAACEAGLYCDSSRGCVGGEACTSEADCAHPGACVVASCDGATRTCRYSVLDGDGDGSPPAVCGGNDCDDADPAIHPGAIESCDGVDSDCSGGPDDPGAPGCRPDQVCDGHSCSCAAAETECIDALLRTPTCADLTTDADHCGSCDHECGRGQECASSACACLAGYTDCGGYYGSPQCRDLAHDRQSCGACGHDCFSLECLDGTCGCVPPAVVCTSATWPAVCATLADDPVHCGSCDHGCLTSATCSAGTCSAEAGFFHAYGALAGFTHGDVQPLLARDTSTGTIWTAWLSGASSPRYEPRTELPGRTTTLWTSPAALLQLDDSGAFVRELDLPQRVPAISAGGGRVMVIESTSFATMTVGPTTLARPSGVSGSWTGVFAIDESGAPIWARAIRGASRVSVGMDGSAMIVLYDAMATDYGSGVTVPASSIASTVLLVVGPDGTPRSATRIIPAVDAVQRDAMDRVVMMATTNSTADVTFGGSTFPGGSTVMREFVAVLSPTGSHVYSFAVAHYGRLIPFDDAVLLVYTRNPGFGRTQSTVERWVYGADTATLDASSGTTFVDVILQGGVRSGPRAVLFGRTEGVAGHVGTFVTQAWDGLDFATRISPTTLQPDAYGELITENTTYQPVDLGAASAGTANGAVVAGNLGNRALIGSLGLDAMNAYEGLFVAGIVFHP